MCPDKELLSAYYDGETDDKWASEIKKHIDQCTNCTKALEEYGKISRSLSVSEVPAQELTKERIYSAVSRRSHVIYSEPFWRKHFDVSFSALAGAAAVVIVLAAALLFGIHQFDSPVSVVDEITPEGADMTIKFISMDDAAAYLLSDDSGFDVLITIPAQGVLSFTGEPQLIREADYRRSQ